MPVHWGFPGCHIAYRATQVEARRWASAWCLQALIAPACWQRVIEFRLGGLSHVTVRVKLKAPDGLGPPNFQNNKEPLQCRFLRSQIRQLHLEPTSDSMPVTKVDLALCLLLKYD